MLLRVSTRDRYTLSTLLYIFININNTVIDLIKSKLNELLFFVKSKTKMNFEESFRASMLKRHNQLRSLHGSPPLEVDAQMEENAQEHSQYLLKTQNFEHSFVHENVGENLAFIFDASFLPKTSENGKGLDLFLLNYLFYFKQKIIEIKVKPYFQLFLF